MTKKQMDRVIDEIYRERCSGMELSVMRIPELFELARGWIERGDTRDQVGRLMVQFVEYEKL